MFYDPSAMFMDAISGEEGSGGPGLIWPTINGFLKKGWPLVVFPSVGDYNLYKMEEPIREERSPEWGGLLGTYKMCNTELQVDSTSGLLPCPCWEPLSILIKFAASVHCSSMWLLVLCPCQRLYSFLSWVLRIPTVTV